MDEDMDIHLNWQGAQDKMTETSYHKVDGNSGGGAEIHSSGGRIISQHNKLVMHSTNVASMEGWKLALFLKCFWFIFVVQQLKADFLLLFFSISVRFQGNLNLKKFLCEWTN